MLRMSFGVCPSGEITISDRDRVPYVLTKDKLKLYSRQTRDMLSAIPEMRPACFCQVCGQNQVDPRRNPDRIQSLSTWFHSFVGSGNSVRKLAC